MADSRVYYNFRASPDSLPPTVDLRATSCFPYLPPRDQGKEGSCVSHSMGAAIECAQRRKGLSLDQAWDPRIEDHFNKVFASAISKERRDPSDGLSFSEAIAGFAPQGVTSYWLKPDVVNMKQAIYSGYPVVFGYTVTKRMREWQDASRAVQRSTNFVLPAQYGSRADKVDGFHAVLAIGYDDSKKALLVRNSWGEDWGDDGHFWFPYSIIKNNPEIVQDVLVIDLSDRK